MNPRLLPPQSPKALTALARNCRGRGRMLLKAIWVDEDMLYILASCSSKFVVT